MATRHVVRGVDAEWNGGQGGAGALKQLPFILVLLLSSGLLLWNFRRYDLAFAAEAQHGAAGDGLEDGDLRTALQPSAGREPGGSGTERYAASNHDIRSTLQTDGTRVALALPVDVDQDDGATGAAQDAELDEQPRDPTVELIVLRLPDGEVRAEGATIDGSKHGRWLEWWAPEQPLSDGGYEYGQRQGAWTYWHENGEVMERGAYKDDLPDGPWTSKHPNGFMKLAVSYTNGLKDGPMFEWAADGSSLRQGSFDAGQPDGRWIESNADGSPRSETHYQNGVRHGPHRAWYTDGQLREQGEYRTGLREGRWVFYDSQSVSIPLRSGYYELGYRHRP
ncbi:MAG: antitoxin component YwqK of YwqJK toxin-antitoxin module [Chlamydiales bacterium]